MGGFDWIFFFVAFSGFVAQMADTVNKWVGKKQKVQSVPPYIHNCNLTTHGIYGILYITMYYDMLSSIHTCTFLWSRWCLFTEYGYIHLLLWSITYGVSVYVVGCDVKKLEKCNVRLDFTTQQAKLFFLSFIFFFLFHRCNNIKCTYNR